MPTIRRRASIERVVKACELVYGNSADKSRVPTITDIHRITGGGLVNVTTYRNIWWSFRHILRDNCPIEDVVNAIENAELALRKKLCKETDETIIRLEHLEQQIKLLQGEI